MSTGARLLLIVLIGGVLLAFASVAAAAAAIYGAGTIAVNVQERAGSHVSVHVPAGLANMVLGLVPDRVIEEALAEANAEIEPWVPAARNAWKQLEQAPDFVLLEVVDGHQFVRVEKQGTQIRVHVDFDDGSVDVAVPLKTVRKLLHKIS